MNKNQLSEFFNTSVPDVRIHIYNILKECELEENSVIKDYLTTASDCMEFNHKQNFCENLFKVLIQTSTSFFLTLYLCFDNFYLL
jgi:hypothetical protein